MIRVTGLVLALVGCAVVSAAEPPRTAAAGPAPRPTTAAAKPAPATPTTTASQPLDLRIGDIRKYMMPRDFQTALRTADADANTVVVEGQREVAPMRMVEDVPMGLGSLWYAAKDPKNAWRLLAPTVTFKDGPTWNKVPPPEFRWGP
ncbi:MAG TPA: hypothetical protein VMF52_07935 [Steroidobacteraceae bacterium]|nr:hypothetical protein [Steroidobacteraceae bacterium]